MLKFTLAAFFAATIAFSEAHAGKVGPAFLVDEGTTTDGSRCNQPSVAGLQNDGFVVVYMCSDIRDDPETDSLRGKLYDSSATVLTKFLDIYVPFDGIRAPSIGSFASSKFVVSWDEHTKKTGRNVIAKRFSSSAVRLGTQTRVNTPTSDDHVQSSVATLSDGGFVVVWRVHPKTGPDGIYGRRYNSAGAPLGAEFKINTQPALYADAPSVAALSTGDFVVAWNSGAQLYNAQGRRVAGEFRFNQHAANQQIGPRVASLKNGAFEIVWLLKGQGVYGQRYNRLGRAVGNEIQVVAGSDVHFPALAGLTDDGFVVTWAQNAGIVGRLYNALGNPTGNSFPASDQFTSDGVKDPAVTGLSSGGFVVIWPRESIFLAGDMFGQRFSP